MPGAGLGAPSPDPAVQAGFLEAVVTECGLRQWLSVLAAPVSRVERLSDSTVPTPESLEEPASDPAWGDSVA